VGIPTTAYIAVDEVETDGKEIHRVFKHIPCAIQAEEAEEVSSHLSAFTLQLMQILFIGWSRASTQRHQ
jgi:hypothetical protein